MSSPFPFKALVFDLHLALVFLTRLPLPGLGEVPPGALARAMRWFPLVGVLVGLAGGLVFLAARQGLPGEVAGLLAVAAMALLTGALHEDGLADTADGLGGAAERERALAIMRDSRIGTYGALALLFSVALRAGALAAVGDGAAGLMALVAAAALSRAALPLVMAASRPARPDGLGAGAGRPTAVDCAIAAGLGLFLVAALLEGAALVAVLAGVAAAAALMGLAARRIGGYTGDVLGAVQQAVETAVLLAAAAAS